MKKLVLLIFLGFFAAFNAMSQCTPDEGCLDLENPGEICPMVFDSGYVNVPYEQVITFIPQATYNYSGMNMTVQKIVINSVSGLPAGLDWDTNAEEFIPTNPITRYCGVIFGTPTTEGEYPFQFAATVTVLIGSVPVEVPVTQETLGYEAKVVILPENMAPPVAEFSASLTSSPGGEVINFTDESFNATTWEWTFEGAMNPTSTEQNPTTTWYTQGTYDVTLTVTNTNCFPPKTHTLIAEDYITITSNVNPYYFQESAQICEGDLFLWQGETYNTQGTHFAYYTSIHGMDSIYELTLTVNPVYFFPETHVLCDGDLYSWHGTDYSTVGVYTATYQTSAGCDSIYELTLTVNPSYEFVTNQNICDGEFFEWRGNNYDVPGTYTDLYYTNNGCDSVFVLNLTVNSLPQHVVVLQNPSDGILTSGNYGQISLSTSFVGTQYWVTMGGAYFTGEIGGTGSGLSLGNSFPPGSYNIWSRNQYGCVLLQGTVSFVENTGANKIVANVTFGTPASNFPANHVKVVLYRETTDIGNNEVVVFEDEQL
ncbi:MAG TPA: PKD domain-containing protein, partial [Bacteroidales bacterium]|nr:PKD domain-containing protein [Bacteroidales bacterium]